MTTESHLDLLGTINLLIATTTFITSIIVVMIYLYWWWHIDREKTNLAPLIGGIAIAKFGILTWSGIWVFQIVSWDLQQPISTLFPRVLIMIAMVIHLAIPFRIKRPPNPTFVKAPFDRTTP